MGQVNRATAQTSHARATDEGLGPLMRYIRSLMNRIIATEFASPDLEFAWEETRAQDPAQAAQIDVAYVGAGILTVDEVRANLGLDPLNKAPALPTAQKYNHYHLGPGPNGGQFTEESRDGTSNGLPPGAGKPQRSEISPPSQAGARGVQVAQRIGPVVGSFFDMIAPSAESVGGTAGTPSSIGVVPSTLNNDSNPSKENEESDGPAQENSTKAPLPAKNFEQPTNQPQAPNIPPDYIAETQKDGSVIYRPPENVSNQEDKSNTIRVMRPTEQYPEGYWRQYNKSGQPIDPSTGGTGTRAQTHTPLPKGYW